MEKTGKEGREMKLWACMDDEEVAWIVPCDKEPPLEDDGQPVNVQGSGRMLVTQSFEPILFQSLVESLCLTPLCAPVAFKVVREDES